jgi:histidine ammonia-lyase
VAASLADELPPRTRASGPQAAAAEALRTVETAEQLLSLELLVAARAPGAGEASATPPAVAAFRAHATFVPTASSPLTPALLGAARFVREYAWA